MRVARSPRRVAESVRSRAATLAAFTTPRNTLYKSHGEPYAAMPSISWLHLTDLHMGMSAQRLLWPDVKDDFFHDLDALHAKTGPWDLVLFTGDLTQQGNDDDFKRLATALDKLWERLAKLGSKPALMAVPGNHDLVRPDAALPAMKALETWHTDTSVRERFWSDASSPERAVVSEAFKHYTRFIEARPLPTGFEVKRGRVPGDVSVSITRPDGLRVALVGLNTALLHLWGGDLTGRLTIEREQLFDVCGDDPPEWLSEHHVALLLTHHPKSWLHPRAVDIFEESVLGRDRFFAHLYGHMHEGRWERSALGGAPERRVAQGPSLFGLEKWGTADQKRIHGYMAGRITIDGERGECRVWPRLRAKMDGGHYKIVPAYGMDLTDEAMVTPFVARKIERAPSPTPPTAARPSPPPPSGPSPEFVAAKALNALDDDAFARALQALTLAPEVTSGEPSKMQKATKVARYLNERGRLAEVAQVVAAVHTIPAVVAPPVAAPPAAPPLDLRALASQLAR